MTRRSTCDPIEYPVQNITEYVIAALGERCTPEPIVLPTVLIYSFILFFGIVGNVCTCIVIVKNKSMHNPTNYYLFSLAISDLLMLILGLPMELYGVFVPFYPYQFGELTCKLRAFLIEFTSYASVLTITCFSIERWFAICFPLRVQVFSSLDRATKVIVGVWIIAFVAASPVLFLVVINHLPLPPFAFPALSPLVTRDGLTVVHTEYCGMNAGRTEDQKRLIQSAFFFFFLLPALLISFVYCHIVVKVRSTNDYLVSNNSSTKSHTRTRKSVLKILVSVVVMFFICWFPFHLQRLVTVFLNERSADEITAGEDVIFWIHHLTFYISGYCYYSNSACNPILYNILSERYRSAFCKTIFGQQIADKLMRKRRSKFRTPTINSSRKVRPPLHEDPDAFHEDPEHRHVLVTVYPERLSASESG